MGFAEWLHRPESNWKLNLELCHPNLFRELNMSKEEVEKVLEKLDEYEVLGNTNRNY